MGTFPSSRFAASGAWRDSRLIDLFIYLFIYLIRALRVLRTRDRHTDGVASETSTTEQQPRASVLVPKVRLRIAESGRSL